MKTDCNLKKIGPLFSSFPCCSVVGDRGTGVREKRGRGAGEEGAGSGILKVAGGGRNRGNWVRNISQSKRRKDRRPNKNRAGTGTEGYGKQEV